MQAQNCPSLLGILQEKLPAAIPRGNALTICENAVQTLARADTRAAQADSDQTWYAVRTVASVAQAPTATLTTYNDRYTTIRNTAAAAVTKAANELLGKLVTAVGVDPPPPTIDPIMTAAQTACTAYQTASLAAINTARTTLNTLVVDATNLMVTPPLDTRGTLFQACQPLLTDKSWVDKILNTLQSTTQSAVINQNIKMKTCLQSIVYSIVYKINASNRLTKAQDVATANKVVSDFVPPQGDAAIAAIFTPLRAAAATQLDALRPLVAGSPQYSSLAITFCSTFTQTLSDAINTARSAVNTQYQTSVTNANKVIATTTT